MYPGLRFITRCFCYICDIKCGKSVYMLLLLYTAAGVRSEFFLSFVDVSWPTVHYKVLLLSSPKAWLVSFNGLGRHCVHHTTWVLLVGVSWPAHSAL